MVKLKELYLKFQSEEWMREGINDEFRDALGEVLSDKNLEHVMYWMEILQECGQGEHQDEMDDWVPFDEEVLCKGLESAAKLVLDKHKADALNALSVLDGDEITEDLRSERMKDLEALNALDGVDFLDDLENQGTEETPNQSAGPGMSGNIKKLGNFGGTQVYGVGPGGATISL
ncbi:MAG: hypothetical protein IIZ78_15700 [Clostridiales bacterium]|nr:hypothetical protein [Clostridiales bacterium]